MTSASVGDIFGNYIIAHVDTDKVFSNNIFVDYWQLSIALALR